LQQTQIIAAANKASRYQQESGKKLHNGSKK
jgi:hypothetical protein